MKRIIGLFLALSVVLFSGSAMAADATIVGGPHDMTWSQQGFAAPTGTQSSEICIYCHTPHNASKTLQLWNRDSSTETFTRYTSYTMDMLVAGPLAANSVSRQCLSCHDGTTAIDAIVNGAANVTVGGAGVMTGGAAGNFGTDLSNDHPIGIVYDTVAATGDTAFNTIAEATADGVDFFGASTNMVECPSCHNVHGANEATITGTSKFLRTRNTGSALCLACHIK